MNSRLIPELHQQAAAPWAWELAPGAAVTLRPDPAQRWLHVDAGSVWATALVAAGQADDIWLAAGDSLALAPCSAWVLEGHPQARLSVLQQSPPALSRAACALSARWWQRDWLRALRWPGVLQA